MQAPGKQILTCKAYQLDFFFTVCQKPNMLILLLKHANSREMFHLSHAYTELPWQNKMCLFSLLLHWSNRL